MVENILACIYLVEANFISIEEYGNYLDSVFMQDIENELLMELEFCSKDIHETKKQINEYIWQKKVRLDYDTLGQFLFNKLDEIYSKELMNINIFGQNVYRLWKSLPEEIVYEEPYCILSYADDYLDLGHYEQAHDLYKKCFSYNFQKKEFENTLEILIDDFQIVAINKSKDDNFTDNIIYQDIHGRLHTIDFLTCANNYANNRKTSSRCVGERNVVEEYFLFYTSGMKTKVIFRKKYVFNLFGKKILYGTRNKRFNQLHHLINETKYTTYDLS